jgi:DNA-binding response OmpR family regulator
MPRSYTILVVDDEPALLEIYCSALSEPGHVVLTAADGYKAIRILVERHVDLVITDINMPGLNGVHLGAQARLMCPGIHVIYITGFGELIDRIAPPRLGLVMRKPIRPAALLQAVEQEMGARG